MKCCVAPLVLATVANGININQEAARVAANPIRKVVTMLQNVQKKVQKEAEAEEELFNHYMCYCKNGAGDLEASISSSDAKVPEVASAIKEAEEMKAQLDADLVAHRSDRQEAKEAMAKATGIRAKEAKAYAAFKAESDTNIAALNKAVTSLENGMAGGSFLQTNTAEVLRNLFQVKATVSDGDRESVLSFLAGSSEYVPQGGQISGILKQLGDDMNKELSDATAEENASIKSFDDLMAAKTKEVNAHTKAIEQKTIRSGETAVNIVMMKKDLTDTEAALIEDKKFLADLETNCEHKKAEWAAMSKTRAEEMVALSETIKLLNDDDALELFKKTLPSAAASLVQVETRTSQIRARAVAVIRAAQKKLTRPANLDFIMLALNGKKQGFGKVLKMIDAMVGTLKAEQIDDDNKKEYCSIQFDAMDDKRKGLEQSVADGEAAIADADETLATLASEIKALNAGIKALDKQVTEATEQRKEENAEFVELMAGNTAAKDLIGMAKNRLNKFYNPKLYVAPPKRELSEEERIAVSMGGTAPPTPAPGGIAGTGISALNQEDKAPAAPPKAPSYSKKSGESTGVIAMMDLLIKDLDAEMQTAEAEEKDAQRDYEQMSGDAAGKRAADSTTVVEKEATKASTEGALQMHQDTKTADTKELLATVEYISALHKECDWLMEHFDVRKEARAGEVEALGKAKAVLNGADFSLLQTTRKSLRGSA